MKLFNKLFLSSYYFTIAIREKNSDTYGKNILFVPDYVMPAEPQRWAADPMIVEHEGQTFMFYESVVNNKGSIAVVSILPDCTFSKPVIILEDNCHYSYPFVFRNNNKWYMIPESSQSNEVRLYCAESFPYKWNLVQILLKEKRVDTTVFEKDGKWYLLTFAPQYPTEKVIPSAYKLNWKDDKCELSQIKWQEADQLKCRGAGGIIKINGKMLRPAQVNQENSYGDSLIFYEISVDDKEYSERYYASLTPNEIKIPKMWYNGTHTYSSTDKYDVIDIRCRRFDMYKIIKIVKKKLSKM